MYLSGVRRAIPLSFVLGIAFLACANSSTPDIGNGGGGTASDASKGDEAPNYGGDDASTSTGDDSSTTTTTDAGRKEGGLPIYDAGGNPDTGSNNNGNACDDSSGSYTLEYTFAVSFGATLGPCSAGCKPTECCFDASQLGGDMVCLVQ